MKVVHFCHQLLTTFFRGSKVTLWVFLAIFLVSVRSIASMGRWTPFWKLNFFEQTGTFWFFDLPALLTRVHFCLLVVFSKTPKWPFWPFLHVSRHGWELRTKSDISQFQNDHFAIFSLFFMISGPFHLSTRPGGEVPGAQRDRPGRAKTVKMVKIIKNGHFSDKSAFCWFCWIFWSFWAEPLYRHHVPFFILNKNFL